MKDSTVSLTRKDLSAIEGLLDNAFEYKVKPLIDEAIDSLSLQVGAGFNEVSERFDRVEADVTELKVDVAELKVDVAEFKMDVSELKTDMREVKWGLADTVRRGEFLDVRARVERLERHHSA